MLKYILVCVLAVVPLSSSRAQSFLAMEQDLEDLAATTSKIFALPRGSEVKLSFDKCDKDKADAYFDPRSRKIHVCEKLQTDMINGWQTNLKRIGKSQEQIDDWVSGAIMFVFVHEIGHAMIKLHNIETKDRKDEEDKADDIATFYLLSGKSHPPDVVDGVLWFFRPITTDKKPAGKEYRETHSLNVHRQSNLACAAYGKDSTRFKYLLNKDFLDPVARAPQCQWEYLSLAVRVRKMLGENLLLKSKF